MEYNELANEIEAIVFGHMGVETQDAFERTKKGDCVKARHLSITIMHLEYKIPIAWLSKRYGFSIRHIFRIVAHIQSYIRYNKHYNEIYNALLLKLSPLTSSL